ncbi:hypothetical protein RJ639_041261 [Escallonia herrerae]|uniref:DNA (cytosine-5-)-methyltransferase n=1 Tax=Escallonia herrerae TaxID=1293975 RepID=A0AA88WKB2_9ASTE|nr:hypothetical protein RJ639_041261 [Escallonia herrerae]
MPSKRKNSSAPADSGKSKKSRTTPLSAPLPPENTPTEESPSEDLSIEEPDFPASDDRGAPAKSSPGSGSGRKAARRAPAREENDVEESRFVGDPVPDEEAKRRWPHRYFAREKKRQDNEEPIIQAKRHFRQALVDGRVLFDLEDDAYVKADDGEDNFICRIVEMFEGVDGLPYITSQWFYRARDTVIKGSSKLIDNRRVFLSDVKDDNPLDCLIEKLRIVRVPLDADNATKRAALSDGDFYCDMQYLVLYSSFLSFPPGTYSFVRLSAACIFISNRTVYAIWFSKKEVLKQKKLEMGANRIPQFLAKVILLDLQVVGYLVKRKYLEMRIARRWRCWICTQGVVQCPQKWAVDINEYACASLNLNHPETQVRNETAENFLALLKEWQKLCDSLSLTGNGESGIMKEEEADQDSSADDDVGEDDNEVFEVEKVLSICYGDPREMEKPGLYLKIRWKGYGPDEDTWEPFETLGGCQAKINEFVIDGYRSKILPLPGTVDVICGGPPCQGVSGFNRFRNKDDPLADEKNKQLAVYMDIVEFLKPKFLLMENVVDIVKFADGFLGRYALGRLVGMNYQARMGMMAAGAYGLPQYRMRMFMWGARPTEKLPQYPLPSHDVVVRGGTPVEFRSNAVDYDEGQKVDLEKKLFLGDAISDLPPVENDECRDSMAYGKEPATEFQRFIRLRKDEMPGGSTLASSEHQLFDHRPLQLNEDDYLRVCQIPKKKGANFRHLRGVRVMADNKVEFDPAIERVLLPSGKPLVPDYAMSFMRGTSSKPFGRLWWDETVPTVVTRAEPHNQIILHPEQDRVLTIRENARLQGFPDHYQLVGTIKERYIQVGNAVAIPVARALGFALGLAFKNSCNSEEPVFILPKKFPKVQDTDEVVAA